MHAIHFAVPPTGISHLRLEQFHTLKEGSFSFICLVTPLVPPIVTAGASHATQTEFLILPYDLGQSCRDFCSNTFEFDQVQEQTYHRSLFTWGGGGGGARPPPRPPPPTHYSFCKFRHT
jgi:hypothetical protein